MKTKFSLSLVALLLMYCAGFAQAPQLLNYQAIVRNAQGNPITTGVVNVRFIIHDGSPTGGTALTETQIDTPIHVI